MNHSRPARGRCAHRAYCLTCDEFDELVAEHSGRCALCNCTGSESRRGVLVIDHDFRYGNWAVRGLLCSRCNTLIDIPGRQRTLAEEAYLVDPWWRRRFGRLGLPTEVLPEPALGTLVVVDRESWKRTGAGWEHAYIPRKSWRDLTAKHPPHAIHVVRGQLALF